MQSCPRCDAVLGNDELPIPDRLGQEVSSRSSASDDSTEWADIARIANLAEAGFITDELIGLGIDARLHQLDEFNAALDRWSTRYLIRVPTDCDRQAAEHISQYLTEDGPGKRPILDAFRFSVTRESGEQFSWRPVAAILLVGVASFMLGQQFSEQGGLRRRQPTALAKAVAEIDRDFVTESIANRPRYRLSFDRQQQAWALDTDRDNDGLFETSRQFTATGIAR